MAQLDKTALLQCVAQFVLIPGVAERTVNWLLRRSHVNLQGKDVDQLSQRFTRAFIAVNLVQGALRTIIHTPNWSFMSHFRSAPAQYYTLGTLIYYVFDTGILAVQKSKAYDLWIHHCLAILYSSLFLINNIGEAGWMALLIAESLVPWGFLLFYFKLNKLRAHPFFKVVCWGGLGTLTMRAAIWLFLIYTTVRYDKGVPDWLWWLIVPVNAGVLLLDYYWVRLYWSNLKEANKIASDLHKSGKSYPSLSSVFTKNSNTGE